MRLRDFILSKQNIYLAIHEVDSYVFDPLLLEYKDKKTLAKLADPYDEKIINKTIKQVIETLQNVLDDDNYLFETQVFFKPKDYDEEKGGEVYRPIHTAKLVDLIAMVALLHPLIYEIPDEKTWKLNLSNYSRLIPNNFYGNRVSKKPEQLFKKWNKQYKKYTQKANEYFKTFHESGEYKYELKLDLEKFFPSINPQFLYAIFEESIPVTLCDSDNIEDFKKIIYKLTVCKITNINTRKAKEHYYGIDTVGTTLTKGIAQGLPQSYFFGNMCMIKVAEIFEQEFPGKSVYYVDDSYIYTNTSIESEKELKARLKKVNKKICEKVNEFIGNSGVYDTLFFEQECKEFTNTLLENEKSEYRIKVHEDGKSTYTEIQDIQDGELYLKILSREASQVGNDIVSTYSDEEDETILNRTKGLLYAIEKEKEEYEEDESRKGYLDKLERYYKFFKYRALKLQLRAEENINKEIFKVLVGEKNEDRIENKNLLDMYSALDVEISKEDFFEKYKHDIWQVAISMLIRNTIGEDNHANIRTYIKYVMEVAYSKKLSKCSYLSQMYKDYINGREEESAKNPYATLERVINKKMIHYSNLHSTVLRNEFEGVRLKGIRQNILESFEICSNDFVDMSKLVLNNSDRMQRMFLNAIYSKVFKVAISDDILISSYDKKGINYGELRTLSFLRNKKCSIDKFLNWDIELMSSDNMQNIDYAIFEVIGAYRRYVVEPENIDKLILVHKYTCDVWKNGAKHLYFYTLHNQEHAVDLVKNIIKIVKTLSYLKITQYDYYLLFIACYLHDISMVRIASKNDFVLDKESSVKKVTAIEGKWKKCKNTVEIKNIIFDVYKELDEYFEEKIRSRHAIDSADEIRNREDLGFLEKSEREIIADISESHMLDTRDVYYLKGDAQKKLISHKFDIILLRFADLLDMSERRVSKPILRHNIENMSSKSAFHWVSHLLTEGYTLTSEYVCEAGDGIKSLYPGNIKEEVVLTIFVKLSQFSKYKKSGCKYGKIQEESISSEGFVLELNKDGVICESESCNFLCRWFNEKNDYLVQEMQALEAYLARVPVTERFYNTKIRIKVVVTNPTDISDEQFEILKREIAKEKV